jgi:hypothetical protein
MALPGTAIRENFISLTNYERVGKSLELLRDELRPFIERELSAKLVCESNGTMFFATR